MNDLSDSPISSLPRSRPNGRAKSWLRRGVNWALGGVVVAWLVVLFTWSALHIFMLPHLADYRESLQQRASQALGVRIEIGRLQVQGGWWVPWLEAEDVRLYDREGREALYLPRVRAAVSPRLLWGELEQLDLEQPELTLRRDAQGQVWVAGFAVGQGPDGGGANWLFSQPQVVVRQGTVHWRDDMRQQAPELTLRDLDVSVQNRWFGHLLRADVTPPEAVGQRLSVQGKFHQMPWRRAGDIAHWQGEAFVDLPHVNLAALRPWVALDNGMSLHDGRGALRLWTDLRQGQVVGLTADARLDALDARLGPDLPPLRLRHVHGRVGAQWSGDKVALSGQDWGLETHEGERGVGKGLELSWAGDSFASGALNAQGLDLRALAKTGLSLPLPTAWRASLAQLEPQGFVHQLKLTWQQHQGRALHYTAQGQVHELSVRHEDRATGALASLPGVQGAQVTFELTQAAGKASVRVHQGSVTLPAGLDEPRIALDDASVQLTWQLKGQDVAVQFTQGLLANADVKGEFSGNWKTGADAQRLPGVLDLTASLARVQLSHVHRYLPTALPASVRTYVREAVQAGAGSQVSVRLRGNLQDMPFQNPQLGEFRIAAQLAHGQYAYVPPGSTNSRSGATLPWPVLTELNGELVFDRNALRFAGQTQLAGAPGVVWHKVQAQIPDLAQAVVQVSAEAQGPLQQVLDVVAKSALNNLTGGVLQKSQASGQAQYQLALTVPVQQPNAVQLHGSVGLSGNALQLMPGTPVLNHLRGQLQFTETDFALKGVQAQMLGGPIQLQGGLSFGPKADATPQQLSLSGELSAEGLRQARELGLTSRLAQHAQGKSAYSARLGLRRGQPELLLTSDLKGLALTLPAPLNKAATASLPLRIETQLTRESLQGPSRVLQDQIKVTLGRLVSMLYVRDLTQSSPRVLRGAIAVGEAVTKDLSLRDNAVGLNLHLPVIDLDAWNNALTEITGAAPFKPESSTKTLIGHESEGDGEGAQAYLPTFIALQADRLKVTERVVHNVMVEGSRQEDRWRLNISAVELNGSVEVRPPAGDEPAQLQARLAYLNIPPSSIPDVERLLSEQPSSIPALDIVVSELTLGDKKLGRLEIEAVNRVGANAAREWRLNKFNLTVPEASLTAQGSWMAEGPNLRRTELSFALALRDSGALLTRLGMPQVVREGEGRLTGQVTWQGSPLTLDYASMSGDLTLNIEDGQFLKTQPGAARLLGVLNLQALPRRLTLDFNDLFSDGFAFDFVRGDVRISQGVAHTNNLQMKGVVAGALMEGSADLAHETQDLKVVVVPEIDAGTASLYMATINPLVGLTSYLAQMILSKPLVRAGTSEFHIDGTWSQPRVVKVE